MSKTLTERRPQGLAPGTPTDPKGFRQLITNMSNALLSDWVGHDRAGEATGRMAAALSSAAASAKKPEDFYTCTPQSIANCVALAALTGIMPSTGAGALAYVIPRSPRQGEQKQLGYHFSHRGLNALAARSGQTMVAVPISKQDKISVTPDGEVDVMSVDFDDPPMTLEELRGIVIVVKKTQTGAVITRGWMPRKLIERRRSQSDSYNYAIKKGNEWAQKSDPWHQWPIEMAIKTAMHYAIGRGWCVIDDTAAVRALNADITVDAVSVTHRDAPPPLPVSTSRTEQLTHEVTSAALPPATTPAETPAEETKPASKPKGGKKKTTKAADTPESTSVSKSEPPPELPKSLEDYGATMHRLSSTNDVARLWTEQIKSNAPDSVAYDAGTEMRDWKLRQLGKDDPDAFMADWEKLQEKKAGAKQGELL